MKYLPSRAFTLVELFVVIAIIGILTAVVYANFGQARAVSRDEVRKTSVKDLELAIKLYKAQNGTYPPQGCTSGATSFAGPGTESFTWAASCANYITGLTPDFIAQLPTDPRTEDGGVGFFYRSNGTDFKLMVFNSLEVKTVLTGDEFGRCPNFASCGGAAADRARTYAVYSSGAITW